MVKNLYILKILLIIKICLININTRNYHNLKIIENNSQKKVNIWWDLVIPKNNIYYKKQNFELDSEEMELE